MDTTIVFVEVCNAIKANKTQFSGSILSLCRLAFALIFFIFFPLTHSKRIDSVFILETAATTTRLMSFDTIENGQKSCEKNGRNLPSIIDTSLIACSTMYKTSNDYIQLIPLAFDFLSCCCPKARPISSSTSYQISLSQFLLNISSF